FIICIEMSALYQIQDDLARVKEKKPFMTTFNKIYDGIVMLIGIGIIILNWAVNDYIGKANCFKTPIATSNNAADLEAQYTFPKGQSISDMSKIGIWMLNYTIDSLMRKEAAVYSVYVGSFPLSTTPDVCSLFKATYAADLAKSSIVRIGVASNSLMFVRGDAISHTFSDDTTTNLANSSMTASQLNDLGYYPARSNVDVRLTVNVPLANTSEPQNQKVSFYRVFPKSFCTGCSVVTEMGFGYCNMTFMYNDTLKIVTITKSSNLLGSTMKVALIMDESKFTSASHYLKFIAILFAVGGYLASRRTVQWKEFDISQTESLSSRILRTVSPKYFPYPSDALRFDMFCYNSDLFVFLFSAAVLLDMQYGLYYSKTINLWNTDEPQFMYSVLMFGISMRFLWLNCATIKLLKLTWNTISTATYNGESKVMSFFNLSSVTSLYLSSILLFYIPQYIAYNNVVTINLDNRVDNLDPVIVDPLQSYYIRSVPVVIVGGLVNIFGILLWDHTVCYKKWQLLAKNSLGRQAIYNSSSIFCDYLFGIELDLEGDHTTTILHCKARRLSTLQWFFMNHMILFGLPEKELRAKKKTAFGTMTIKTNSTTPQEDQLPNGKYLFVQDGDHHLHLVDDHLSELTATNEYVRQANCFKTSIATPSSTRDLEAQYTFPNGRGISDMSRIAIWMVNYTIAAIINRDGVDIYLINVGTYPLTPAIDMCGIFKASYAADLSKSNNVNLSVAVNSPMFILGDAISHTFSDTSVNLANSSMKALKI
ncbi:hypothetical protein THRCLA_04874, partial [Thraustotheca clavata]